jgi:two-component system response regulator NreC
MTIRIVLADDHKIVRDGLKSMLAEETGMQVVAEAEDGRTAVRLAHDLSPDVVVMDVGMPELNGIDACRQIADQLPHVRVIALSMHSDRHFVQEMLKAGASGYLLKDCAFDELAKAIRSVMANGTYLCPAVAVVVVDDYVRRLGVGGSSKTARAAGEVLTAREREVLQLLAEGKSTKQVATTLFVSVKTVETHRHQIMEKLDLHSLAELTKYAVREGLTWL